MEILTVCPLPVGAMFWRSRREGSWLTVMTQATFDLAPGELSLADSQEPLRDDDVYPGDDRRRAPRAPSDLVPYKARADVLVVGSAYAPEGRPVRSMVVRIIVGDVDKSVEIYLDRHWSQQGELVEGERFGQMSLSWEHAPGGPDTSNPLGVDHKGEPDGFGRVALPNLQPPGLNVTERSDVIEPVGLGPIPSAWEARAKLLGAHAARWSHDRWYLRPLPEDIDSGFFQAAPLDQRTPSIRSNERIILEGLHPEHARLVAQLPGLAPRALALRQGAVRPLELSGDTLCIDTERRLCTVTWRGRVQVASVEEAGQVVVALDPADRQLTWAEIQALIPEGRPAQFVKGSKHDLFPAHLARRLEGVGIEQTATVDQLEEEEEGEALPFLSGQPAAPLPTALDSGPTRDRGATEALPTIEDGAVAPPWLQAVAAPRAPAASSPAERAAPTAVSPWAQAGAARPPGPTQVGLGPHGAPPPLAPPGRVVAPPPVVAAAAAGARPLLAPNPARDLLTRPSPDAGPVWEVDDEDRSRPPAPSREAGEGMSSDGIVELLWFEPEEVGALRNEPAFADALRVDEPPEPAKKDDDEEDFDPLDFSDEPEPEPEEEPAPSEDPDEKAVAAILTRGPLTPCSRLAEAMREAVKDQRFKPPWVVVDGVLELGFDEKERLDATLSAVMPFAQTDKKLKETLDAVKELKGSELMKSDEILAGLTKRVVTAFGDGNRVVSGDYLAEHTERALLERRAFKTRAVLGKKWLRATITQRSAQSPVLVPTYLPIALKEELPLFRLFHARLIARARPQQDQFEKHPHALVVAALGRIVRFSTGSE